jgi:hypothetical protein
MHVLVDDLLFLTLLLWYIISYASFYIAYHTCAPCVVYKDLGRVLTNCLQSIWGLFLLTMHTFRGSLLLHYWIYTSLLHNQIVLPSITKKGETESASRPLIVLVIMSIAILVDWCFQWDVCRFQRNINWVWSKEAPNNFYAVLKLKWSFNSFYLLNLSLWNIVL